MAPSGPRGLRGWLGAMFGHGGAAVPIIRPLEIQKTNGIRSRVGSEWAKGPFGPHFVGLVRSLEPLEQPFQRYYVVCAVRLVLKVNEAHRPITSVRWGKYRPKSAPKKHILR